MKKLLFSILFAICLIPSFAKADIITDVLGTGYSGGGSVTDKRGMQITVLQDALLTTVTKDSSVTATYAYIEDSTHTPIAFSAFSGDDATFSVGLESGSVYYVLVDAEGSNYSQAYDLVSLPVGGSVVDYTDSYFSGGLQGGYAIMISSLTFNVSGGGTISGCTDPDAINYSSIATVDDGSCIYSTPVPLIEVSTSTLSCSFSDAVNLSTSTTTDDWEYSTFSCSGDISTFIPNSQSIQNIVFALAILVVLMFIITIGFIFNSVYK